MKDKKIKLTRGLINKIIILGVPALILLGFLLFILIELFISIGSTTGFKTRAFSNDGIKTVTQSDGTSSTETTTGTDSEYLGNASSVKNMVEYMSTNFYDGDSAYDKIERLTYEEYKKLNEYDIRFQATEYNYSSDKAFKFSLAISESSEFDSAKGTKALVYSSSYYLRAGLCLSAPEIPYEKYYTSPITFTKSNLETALSSSYSEKAATITVDDSAKFPYAVSHWPFTFYVKTPKVYLYLQYAYTLNAEKVAKQYVIEYSFDDYYITQAKYEADQALEKPLGYVVTKGGIL